MVLLWSIFFQKAGYPATTLTAKRSFQLPLNINKQGSKGDAIPQGVNQIFVTGIWNVCHEALCFVRSAGRWGESTRDPAIAESVTAFIPKH